MIMNLSTETVSAPTAAKMARIIIDKAAIGDKRAQEIVTTAQAKPIRDYSKPIEATVEEIHEKTQYIIAQYIEVNGDIEKAVKRLQNELTKAIVYAQFDKQFGFNQKSRANRGPKAGPIKYFKQPVKPGEKGEYPDEEEGIDFSEL